MILLNGRSLNIKILLFVVLPVYLAEVEERFIFRKYWIILHIIQNIFLQNYLLVIYINTIKTTFDLNFDVYQAFEQHKNGNKEKCSQLIGSGCSRKLVI